MESISFSSATLLSLSICSAGIGICQLDYWYWHLPSRHDLSSLLTDQKSQLLYQLDSWLVPLTLHLFFKQLRGSWGCVPQRILLLLGNLAICLNTLYIFQNLLVLHWKDPLGYLDCYNVKSGIFKNVKSGIFKNVICLST